MTLFVDAYSGYAWAYGHLSTAEVPDLFARFYADTSPLRELHGALLCVRSDNASVNVSRRFQQQDDTLAIRHETSNPYEPWQLGAAERMNQTVVTVARTVLLASGLPARFWFHASTYGVRIHNIQYSRALGNSPYILMHKTKPDVSNDHPFGVEAWIYLRPDQRPDPKFSARGEAVIFVGYPTNQHGYLVWCPSRGPGTVVSTTNVTFGIRCPLAKDQPTDTPDLFGNPSPSPAFAVFSLESDQCLRVVDSKDGQLWVRTSLDNELRTLPEQDFLRTLEVTAQKHWAEAHLSLVDSLAFLAEPLPSGLQVLTAASGQAPGRSPKTVKEALSPEFLPEWGPAMDREISGFVKHECFAVTTLPPGARCLPGIWIFSRKRDGSAKARFVVGGHRQLEGKDYFADQTYAAVLASQIGRAHV